MNPYKVLWHTYRNLARIVSLTGLTSLSIGNFCLGERLDYLVRRWILFPMNTSVINVHGHLMQLSPWQYEYAPEFLAGTYEIGTTRFFELNVHRGMTIVDCGAHVGYYSLLAARLVEGQGRVYAFEPTPESYSVLVKNIELNGYDNVVAVRKAVAEKAGIRALYESKRRTGTNSLYGTRISSGPPLTVEAITLDEFLESEGWPYVHLIKMDIEGAELAALDGAQVLLRRQRQLKLIVEFSPVNLRVAGVEPEEFLGKLACLGFRVRAIEDSAGLESIDVRRTLAQTKTREYLNLFCEK